MKLRLSLLILLVVYLSLSTALAQHGILSGRVTDKETGESLVGANIYVKKNMSIGVVTDFNGHFSVSVNPGEYIFTISFLTIPSRSFKYFIKFS